MTVQTAGPVYFTLKDAKDYRFYNRVGRRMIHLKKGEVLECVEAADIAYFRARPDVMYECTPEGVPMDELGRKGHMIPGKSKSFRVYGRQAKAQPEPVPSPRPQPRVMQVGNVQPAAQPAPAVQPVAAAPSPVVTVTPAAQTPGERLSAIPAPRTDISPIEEAAPDGSTRAVRPRVDPGM